MSGGSFRPSWTRRWLIIRITLIWCAIAASYVIVLGPDDSLRETALIAIASLAGSVVCGYLGFAVYDDRNVMVHLKGGRGGRSREREAPRHQEPEGDPP